MSDLTNNKPESVAGKTVLITGGTTGIGRATAILLASQGANIITFGLNRKHLEDALEDIVKAATGSVHGFIADVATEEGIQQIFDEVDSRSDTLDILVNNAALPYGSIIDGGYSDWKYVLETNLFGYLACSSEAIKRMRARGEGHIVNIGSMSADVREESSSVYVATKSGIQGFSNSLRKQVNPLGIKISLIEPGAVDTDMQPEDTEKKKENVENLEMLGAADIAAAVLYCLTQPKRCDIVELKIRPHLQLI